MATQAKTSTAIKDLIIINNDRYQGYKTALEEIKDSELKSLFTSFSTQSRTFADALRKFTPSNEQPEKNETDTAAKLHRAWIDLKSKISSNDRKAILSSCEFGEDAAKKHYEEALKDPGSIPPEALQIIHKQNEELKKAHDRIKAMRDSIA